MVYLQISLDHDLQQVLLDLVHAPLLARSQDNYAGMLLMAGFIDRFRNLFARQGWIAPSLGDDRSDMCVRQQLAREIPSSSDHCHPDILVIC